MIKAIFCDWNRTIFEDRYEHIFFRDFAKKEAFHCLKRMNISKLFSVMAAKHQCEKIFNKRSFSEDYRSGDIEQIIHILNKRVIRKTSARLLEECTEHYAKDGVRRLDRRILNPLKTIQLSKGIILGIISSGYNNGIDQILKNAGYAFDFIKANDFEIHSDRVVQFRLEVFNNKDKILAEFLAEQSIKGSDVIYIGDDEQDECCLRMVGHPIVSFMANKEYKKRFREKFHAFVPKDNDDFAHYIYDLVN